MVSLMPPQYTDQVLPRLQSTPWVFQLLTFRKMPVFHRSSLWNGLGCSRRVPDDGSDEQLKWRRTLANPTPLWCTWWLKHKGESQDSALLHGEDEETCYEQTVSWNNETNLLGKSEFIHDYVHESLTADLFPFVINISNAISYAA